MKCPVRLLHAIDVSSAHVPALSRPRGSCRATVTHAVSLLLVCLQDEEVPYSLALQLVNNVASTDASVVLLKKSNHAMESERDMKTMRSM